MKRRSSELDNDTLRYSKTSRVETSLYDCDNTDSLAHSSSSASPQLMSMEQESYTPHDLVCSYCCTDFVNASRSILLHYLAIDIFAPFSLRTSTLFTILTCIHTTNVIYGSMIQRIQCYVMDARNIATHILILIT
jgi:hypothetical protein